MTPANEPRTDADLSRRPFRALEATLHDTEVGRTFSATDDADGRVVSRRSISRWNPRADVEVDGDDHDDILIGGDRGPSPRATVTLIGTGGSLIRGGTLIGAGGTRAPRDPAPPAGSGGAPHPAAADRDGDAGAGVWDGADDDLDHALLVSLAADRERLTDIARALGACPECWGERIGCPRCGGVGRPGAADPGAEAFDWYVRPLLNRLDATGSSERRPRPSGSEAHPAGRGPSVGPIPT